MSKSYLGVVLMNSIVISSSFLLFNTFKNLFNVPAIYKNNLKKQKEKIESYREVINENKTLTEIEKHDLNHLINNYVLEYDKLEI